MSTGIIGIGTTQVSVHGSGGGRQEGLVVEGEPVERDAMDSER
jgi:hypothetical protein